jgi:signal transduction histidine kinase
MRPPSLLPLTDPEALKVHDGLEVPSPKLCRDSIFQRPECAQHYSSSEGRLVEFRQCPFGFTTQALAYAGKTWFISGVVAHPRFDNAKERELAKRFPISRVRRETVDAMTRLAAEIEQARADAIVESSLVLPQAFHELRKLNGAVIQHAERVIADDGESRSLLSIKGAAELMRNNFDLLEALSNIDSMKSLPLDSTVNVYDLAFKMKRVYQEKAAGRSMNINVQGIRAIIRGSQKSFPLVPAVLLENAIKYGTEKEQIYLGVHQVGNRATLIVENISSHKIDPERCFDRGVRFAGGVEGGGFGLFLAREVVLAHHGKITCEVAGDRVRMVVDLPFHAVIP